MLATTAPLALLLTPVTVPIGIAIGSYLYDAKNGEQDLSPVSEDES